jgi:hypothetical protein
MPVCLSSEVLNLIHGKEGDGNLSQQQKSSKIHLRTSLDQLKNCERSKAG